MDLFLSLSLSLSLSVCLCLCLSVCMYVSVSVYLIISIFFFLFSRHDQSCSLLYVQEISSKFSQYPFKNGLDFLDILYANSYNQSRYKLSPDLPPMYRENREIHEINRFFIIKTKPRNGFLHFIQSSRWLPQQ